MKFILGMITGIAISTIFFLWYAKKNLIDHNTAAPDPITESVVTKTDDFPGFYQRFHNDSLFQIEHTIFPLEGIPPRDSLGQVPENFHWQKEDWVIHKPFNDQDGSFVQEFTRFSDDMMVEQIKDSSGSFGMQRRFAKVGGEWHLIYYAAMNQFAKKE